jgi:hypothetical protein
MGENDWARKQEAQVCSCALGWAENRRLTQPESDRERAVGEDKAEQWDDAENSWQNALILCIFMCLGIAAQQGQGWSITTATPRLWSKFSSTLLNSTRVTAKMETTATE